MIKTYRAKLWGKQVLKAKDLTQRQAHRGLLWFFAQVLLLLVAVSLKLKIEDTLAKLSRVGVWRVRAMKLTVTVTALPWTNVLWPTTCEALILWDAVEVWSESQGILEQSFLTAPWGSLNLGGFRKQCLKFKYRNQLYRNSTLIISAKIKEQVTF